MTQSREDRAASARAYQLKHYKGIRIKGEGHKAPVVSPSELADRARRATLVPRDLTGQLMGDPPLGWLPPVSALTPSIVHDALDDLFFGRVRIA